MRLKRASRKKRPTSSRERKRRELQGYLDKLKRLPNPTQQDLDLQVELQQALRSMKRQ